MAFDQSTRNRLQRFVNDARSLLSEEFTRQLQSTYGLDPKNGDVADVSTMSHLDSGQLLTSNILRDTLNHYLSTIHGKGEKDRTKQALNRIVREQAFTVLNRLAALRMAEARGFLLETIAKGHNAKGFQLYKQLAGSSLGETGDAYRHYLFSVFDEFSLDLAVLFDRHSAQGRLFPRESALLELLELINHHEIEPLWAEDETIGWIYQYFNSQEERKKMRAESQAPRNSRELAVRNQFFTPRYVVEFLTDNTLGRIWYEMTQGKTSLIDSCHYLVRRPTEVFLKPGELAPEQEKAAGEAEALSQEELLNQPVYIPHRDIKDPRCIRMLDPACGSMHFGLYAFDLYERIYEEAWQLEAELGAEAFVREGDLKPLHQTYKSFEDFKVEIPRLIIEHNIHGVDIDPRAVQIAGLSLWQRAQRSWQQQGIKPQQRPVVRKSNIVCAEPMPGEKALLQEFSTSLNPPVLGQLIEAIFDKMELAGEAGTLLKIEEEIQSSIHKAREQWQARSGSHSVDDMFQAELDQATPQKELGFDLSGVDDESFWDGAEQLILDALSNYADKAELNADQKRLFAEDAAKGFAFIDLSRKRFDVVLMNPPFGQAAISTRSLLEAYYPVEKGEIAACFISRAGEITSNNAKIGCLATRLLLSLPSYEIWRVNQFLSANSLTLTADLGYGVLDAAVVEAASYVQSKGSEKYGLFIDCLQDQNKQASLAKKISSEHEIKSIPLDAFRHLPASVIAHFVNLETIRKIADSRPLVDQGVQAYKGINTSDDFRFLRLSWENLHNNCADFWKKFAKGGEWNPYWDDIHLEVNWRLQGEEIRSAGGTIRNLSTQGRPGLTYPERTTSSFGPRVLPVGTIYSSAGMGIFANEPEDVLPFLSVLLSRQGQFLIELSLSGGDSSVSGTAARHYTNGMINRLPIPNLEGVTEEISIITKHLIHLKRRAFNDDETSREFVSDKEKYECISDYVRKGIKRQLESYREQASLLERLDDLVEPIFGFTEDEISNEVGRSLWGYTAEPNEEEILGLYLLSESDLIDRTRSTLGGARYVTKNSQLLDRKIELISHVLSCKPSHIVSCLLNSIEAIESCVELEQIGLETSSILFANLFSRNFFEPVCQKSEFVVSESVRYSCGPSVLSTDSCSAQPFTLVEGLDRELKNRFSDEKFDDVLNAIKVKNIEDFSQRFFDYHLGQYSKSRRMAPIYWPLQTSSGSYTLWLYYHRLNEQTLYTCVNDFVEPRLQQVEQDINNLRGQLSRKSREERELEKLSDLVSELRDFREELLRLAKFWKPNLNDGVQVTAAPLWKLFQHKAWQKKLKETWEKLEKGDYDWAHLACSIWPERVLRKCHQDRSLAIAHEVEDTFWHEVEVPVMRGKKATGETRFEWQPKELTEKEIDSLIESVKRERNL